MSWVKLLPLTVMLSTVLHAMSELIVFLLRATIHPYRKILEQKNQAVIGALLQMAEQRDGGAGSDSIPKPKSPSRRTKDTKRKTEPETRTGF